MIVLYLILLAVFQAVTEFIPVSSFGHLCVAEQLFGIGHDTGLLIEAMLHLGTAAAIIFLFKKDLKQIGIELLQMFLDVIGNINLLIHNKKTGKHLNYARIVTGTYRKFAALLVISMIPTVCLGLVSSRLAVLAADSSFFPGIGFLITGVLLLVTDLNKIRRNERTERGFLRYCDVDRNLSGTCSISWNFQDGLYYMCSAFVRIQP